MTLLVYFYFTSTLLLLSFCSTSTLLFTNMFKFHFLLFLLNIIQIQFYFYFFFHFCLASAEFCPSSASTSVCFPSTPALLLLLLSANLSSQPHLVQYLQCFLQQAGLEPIDQLQVMELGFPTALVPRTWIQCACAVGSQRDTVRVVSVFERSIGSRDIRCLLSGDTGTLNILRQPRGSMVSHQGCEEERKSC